MKKHYYYNGSLVRTSERDYKYAVVWMESGKVVACCGDYLKAVKRLKSEIAYRSDKSTSGYREDAINRLDIVELTKVEK